MSERRSYEERLGAARAFAVDLNAEPLLTEARFHVPARIGDRDNWPPAFALFDKIRGRHGFIEWYMASGQLGAWKVEEGKLSEPVLGFHAPNTEDPEFVLIQLRSNDLRGPAWHWVLYAWA